MPGTEEGEGGGGGLLMVPEKGVPLECRGGRARECAKRCHLGAHLRCGCQVRVPYLSGSFVRICRCVGTVRVAGSGGRCVLSSRSVAPRCRESVQMAAGAPGEINTPFEM